MKREILRIPVRMLRCLEALFLPRGTAGLSYDTPRRLLIPTYDGSGQAVHPDILLVKGAHPEYLLAFTPYPYGNDRFENPSIVVSTDGLRFREEARGLNPLVTAPPVDHNDDPDLFRDEAGYGLIYLETLRPESQNVVLLRSTDRVSWRRTLLIRCMLHGVAPDPLIVSPAVMRRPTGWYLYYVNASLSPHRIEYLHSKSIAAWDLRERRAVIVEPLSLVPWHVDVVEGDGALYMLITSIAPERTAPLHDLHVARSTDGVHWTLAPRPVFPRLPLGARFVYRSTAFCRNGDLFIYFSYKSSLNEWRIGLVRKRIAELFGPASSAGRSAA